jgi:hypothetical protein
MTDISDEAVRAFDNCVRRLGTTADGLRAALPFFVPPRVVDAALRERMRQAALAAWEQHTGGYEGARLAGIDAMLALLPPSRVVVTEEMVELARGTIVLDTGNFIPAKTMRASLEAALAAPPPPKREHDPDGGRPATIDEDRLNAAVAMFDCPGDSIRERPQNHLRVRSMLLLDDERRGMGIASPQPEPGPDLVAAAVAVERQFGNGHHEVWKALRAALAPFATPLPEAAVAATPQPEPAVPAPTGEERSFVYYEEAAEISPQAWAGSKPPAPDARLAKIAELAEAAADACVFQGETEDGPLLGNTLKSWRALSAYFRAVAERERGR